AVLADLMVKPGNVAGVDGHDAGALAELASIKHRSFAERDDRYVHDRARLVEPGVLEMADDEGVIAFAFCPDRVADHLPRAAEPDDWMGIIVVRGDALDLDFGAGVDDSPEMPPQPVPIGLAVRLVDVALMPDADRVHASS